MFMKKQFKATDPKNTLLQYLKTRKLPILIALIYLILSLLLLLNRFWQFEAYYYDQGYYETTIWKISRFQAPITEHLQIGKANIFADHLVPSLFLLAPFYWITDQYETTVILTAISVALSIPFAYEIARKLIKSKLWIYGLLFAFMFFIGLQNALIFFAHPETIMILPLMILFWSILTDKKNFFYLLLFINLGFKENVAALTFTIGLFLIFYKKSWKKDGAITMTISLAYFFLATKLIQPYFSPNGKYYYEPNWLYAAKEFPARFFLPVLKIKTLIFSFAAFAFLPLFFVPFLPIILQDFLLRFVLAPQGEPHRWDLGLAYSANLAVTLFVGSCFAINRLQKVKYFEKISAIWAVTLIIVVVVFHRFIFHGPYGLTYNRDFYSHTKNLDFLRSFISKVPTDGKIMTQNNLAVFFTHNDLVLIKSCGKINKEQPDTIAFDLRSGQSANNFWPSTEKELNNILVALKESSSFHMVYEDGNKYIFRKDKNSIANLKCFKDESI